MPRHPAPAYLHAQTGPWGLVLLAFGLGLFATAVVSRSEAAAVWICSPIGLLFLTLAGAFHHLTVEDTGDGLSVRFGPLPICRTTIAYHDVRAVEPDRSLLIESWGIHMSPRGGWVWNIWGRDCVAIYRETGVIRVGTDDLANLVEHLRQRMGGTDPGQAAR